MATWICSHFDDCPEALRYGDRSCSPGCQIYRDLCKNGMWHHPCPSALSHDEERELSRGEVIGMGGGCKKK